MIKVGVLTRRMASGSVSAAKTTISATPLLRALVAYIWSAEFVTEQNHVPRLHPLRLHVSNVLRKSMVLTLELMVCTIS
jgi:hypothetical protein